jgi:hypothetical protein
VQDGGVDDARERKMAFGKVLGGEFDLTVAAVRCWKLPGGDLHVGGCDVMAVSLVTGGAGSRSYCSDLGALFRDTQLVPIRGRPYKRRGKQSPPMLIVVGRSRSTELLLSGWNLRKVVKVARYRNFRVLRARVRA